MADELQLEHPPAGPVPIPGTADTEDVVEVTDIEQIQTESLTPIQRIGFPLAKYILCLITGITVPLVAAVIVLWAYYAVRYAPDRSAAPEAVKAAIETYEELTKDAVTNALGLFDAIVVKALLPILTAVLGYLFGSREAMRQPPR